MHIQTAVCLPSLCGALAVLLPHVANSAFSSDCFGRLFSVGGQLTASSQKLCCLLPRLDCLGGTYLLCSNSSCPLTQLQRAYWNAGHVIFVIKSQYDEFELPLKTWKNRILLESLQKQLEMHKPPLRPKSINNVPISVRHNDRTLQVKLHNGQRLEVEAEPLPGKVCACSHLSCTKLSADQLAYRLQAYAVCCRI